LETNINIMKKILLFVCLASCMASNVNAQNLTQSNFTCTILPQVMGSGSSSRLPLIFQASLSGLAPNTVYRYYTNLAAYTDFGGTNSGAGNPLFINSSTFRYTTSVSLTNQNGYDSIETDASGNYTGWFAAVNTGNARFTAGNYVHPSIVLDSSGNKRGVTNSRFVALDSVLVLGYNASAGSTNGTAIRGMSNAAAKNIVVLYDNTTGTGRPVSTSLVEDMGVTISSLASFYSAAVAGVSGAWGTIIPNTLANGILRLEQRSLTTGQVVFSNTSSNGTWGTTNTVNPAGGATALVIASTDAPLPVVLKSFTATQTAAVTVLKWSTASELNNSHFEIQRSVDGKIFNTIASIKGARNASKVLSYTFEDKHSVAAGIVYYRLKLVDIDGTSTYSQTLSIASKIRSVSLGTTLPNPFNNELTINIQTNMNAVATVSVIDMIGKVHYVSNEVLPVGNHQLTVATTDMPNGIYFVRVTANGETYTQKVVKK
jgi:hypothetical protein